MSIVVKWGIMMNIGELIEILNTYEKDLPVCYVDEFDIIEVSEVILKQIGEAGFCCKGIYKRKSVELI